MATAGNLDDRFICTYGGSDQHGITEDVELVFILDPGKPANFVVSNTTLKYED